MTEERRAAPAPKPLDSAGSVPPTLGPDSTTTEVAPVPSTPSLSDSEPPPPSRQGARDSSPGRRRGRTTLRIPDDEVTRPQVAASDGARESAPPPSVVPPVVVAAPPPAAEPAVVLMPTRIISINPTEGPPEPLPEAPPPLAAPVMPPHEDSWTPYQPTVIDAAPTDQKIEARARLASDDLIPIDTDVPAAADSVPESLEPDDIQPANPTPVPPPPPLRAVAPTEPEGEEVRFDDDAPTPAVPAVSYVDTPPSSDRERRSDPGAEIAAEDLVAVEPLPPMRPRLASTPPTVPTAEARKGGTQPLPPVKAPLVIVPPHVGTVAPQSGEGSGLRRKGRLWWEDLFNDDYLRTCEKLTDEQIAREVDFVEDSLGIERGGAVLDLACGTGRHTIELARRGYEVVGFDLSLAMLARAGEDAQDHDAKVNFVQGDMREMTFDEQFDGVFCWNTSFGFFEEEKNALVVDHIHRSLRAGGLFLLDVINRDFLIRQSPSLAWFEGDGCVCMDEMSVDFITSRMKVKRTMMLDDGRSREIEYSMRVYSLHELGKILHDHGFKVCEVSGRVATPGVFFGNESPRTIILAEKR
ncbi:MAG: methyltransferase domain-containing protein [Polyangiaceae bacterium]